MALKSLIRQGHPVIAIGKKTSVVDNVIIHELPVKEEDIDTITLYLSPKNQLPYYDFILSVKPKRVIFNPGTENPELEELLQSNDIQSFIGCTLVMLQTGQF
jgi:predicted CoA-binding protein